VANILVTGGAGYIGSVLVPKLISSGHTVTVFDNLTYGGNHILSWFDYENFSFVRGDIRNINELKDIIKGNDIIIHLAALVGFPACRMNPELAVDVNVEGTRNIIDVCGKDQIIFYGSTGSNYGEVFEICTEETPLKPLSLYGETKTQAETMVVSRENSIAYRFATAFGISPRLRLDLLINDFTNKCLKDGYLVVYEKDFMRTFIHVADMANSFLFGINHIEQMIGEVYNVGDDSMNYSKEAVCKIISKKTGAFVHYEEVGNDADKRNYIVSYDKIKKLGFDVTINLEDGIEQIINALGVVQFDNSYSNARYYK